MKITAIGFVAVPVTNIGQARSFYEEVLGLRTSDEMMGGKWIEYTVGEDTLAIANVNDTWTPSDQGTGAAFEGYFVCDHLQIPFSFSGFNLWMINLFPSGSCTTAM